MAWRGIEAIIEHMGTRLHAAAAALRGVNAENEALLRSLSGVQEENSGLRAALDAAIVRQEELSKQLENLQSRAAESAPYPSDPWAEWLGPTLDALRTGGAPKEPRKEVAELTLSAPAWPRRAGEGQPNHPLAARQRERRRRTLKDLTLKKSASLASSYVDFCARNGYPDPTTGWDKYVLSEFLWHKSQSLAKPNAASWSDWQSRIISFATLTWELPDMSHTDRSYLRTERVACQKSVGIRTVKQTPVGRATLRAIHEKVHTQLVGDARLRATFDQLVVMLNLVVRAGEVADTGRSKKSTPSGSGARVELDALPQARDVTFIPPSRELPHGGVRLLLYDTKRERLTGEGKHEGEPAFAAGTGDTLCPVAALKRVFEAHNLGDEANGHEVIFAALLPSGKRKGPATAGGKATPITSRELNEQIARICALAQWPTFTMRATRYGACCDMEAAGVPGAIANAAGRWKEGSRAPYSSMTLEAAALVARRIATV